MDIQPLGMGMGAGAPHSTALTDLVCSRTAAPEDQTFPSLKKLLHMAERRPGERDTPPLLQGDLFLKYRHDGGILGSEGYRLVL